MRTPRRRVLPGGGRWNVALRLANLATTLVTFALYTRALEPERFGSFAMLSALVLGLAVADLGLGPVLVRVAGRAWARNEHQSALDLLRVARRKAIFVSTPVLVVLAIAVGAGLNRFDGSLAGLRGPALIASLTTTAVLGVAVAALGMASKLRLGFGEVEASCKLQCVGCVVQIPAVVVASQLDAPLWILLIGFFTSQLVGGLLDSIAVERRSTRATTLARLPPHIRRDAAGFAVIVAAGTAAFGLDAVVTGVVLGPVGAGMVALAGRVVLTPYTIVAAAFVPAWGEYSRAESTHPAAVRGLVIRHTSSAMITTAVVCVSAGVAAQPTVHALAGSSYDIDPVLVWSTVASGIVLGTAGALALAMNGLGLVWAQVPIALGSGSVNIVASVGLCHWIGVAGAPLATALTHALLGVVPATVILHQRLTRRPRPAAEALG